MLLVALLALSGIALADEQDTHNLLERIWLERASDLVKSHHVSLTVNVTEVEGASAWARVEWQGVKHPSYDDWVGVIAPANAHIKDATPVKYKSAVDSPDHLETGCGSTTFLLENHRTDLRIGFFLNGFSNPHLVAKTPAIAFTNPNIPQHGRVSLTGRAGEALIQWTTSDSEGGVVTWGRKPGKHSESKKARHLTYQRHEMCGGDAKHKGWLPPGHFHYALLSGLRASTHYFYTFGSPSTGFSKEFSFLTAPDASADAEVKVIVLADMGQAELDGSDEQSEMVPSGNTTRLMLDAVRSREYSLMAHFGDISYARGHVSQWDRYHVQIEPLVTAVPYMTAMGNHERDWPASGDRFGELLDSGGECGVAAERRFLMPSRRQDEPWFHYEHGPITFVHYSTEQHFHKGSKQHDAIKEMLESVDRRRTPWLVFGGHRPMYIDSPDRTKLGGDQTVAEDLREAFEELLHEYHVDFTLHGHHHSYQRTCAVLKGECVMDDGDGVARAMRHFVIGNAGAALGNVYRHKPTVFEKVHTWWGYSRVHANGTRLKLEAITDLDGTIFDTVELHKPKDWGARWHEEHGDPVASVEEKHWWWEEENIESPPQVALHARLSQAQASVPDASRLARTDERDTLP